MDTDRNHLWGQNGPDEVPQGRNVVSRIKRSPYIWAQNGPDEDPQGRNVVSRTKISPYFTKAHCRIASITEVD